MDDIGKRVKDLRTLLKITQKDFADRLFVSASYISKVESGKENPTDMLIKLIALDFNISLDWLKTGKGNMRLQKGDSDYFDREYESPFKEHILCVFNELIELINVASNSLINLSIANVIGSFSQLLSLKDLDINYRSLLIKKAADIFLSYTETIMNIENLDKNSPEFSHTLYSQIHNALDDISFCFLEVKKHYEQKNQ